MLNFLNQFLHRQVLGCGNLFQVYLFVYLLNDVDLDLRLVDGGFHHYVSRRHNIVFIHILADEVQERLSEFLYLAHAHAAYMRQVILCGRVYGGHLLQRRILEQHVRWQSFFLSQFLAQVL